VAENHTPKRGKQYNNNYNNIKIVVVKLLLDNKYKHTARPPQKTGIKSYQR